MNKFNIGLLAMLLSVMLGCGSKESQQVRVRGHISDTYVKTIPLYCQSGGGLYYSKDIYIKVNEKGDFDTTLVLDKPYYFKAWKNEIYLSPGDDLEVNFDFQNKQKTIFEGIGADANNFLLDCSMGFLGENGKNTKSDFQQTKHVVDSIAGVRYNDVKQLNGLSSSFVKDAKETIIAKQISSYISYFLYSKYYSKNLDYNSLSDEIREYVKEISPSIKPLLKRLLSNDHLIDVPAVYSVVDDCIVFGDFELSKYPVWDECVSLNQMEKKLDESMRAPSLELLNEAKQKYSSLTNEEYKKGLLKRIKSLSKLMKGAEVPELLTLDSKNNEVKLSDYKGKLIYIDFWATWCGPCRQELPFYHKLIEKFKGKDIVFLSISTDQDKEKWQSFIADETTGSVQLYPKDISLISKHWQINGIPRFVLIGKDFTLIDAFADRPSSKDIIENKINSLL